MIHIVNLDRKE
jgi:hypothetical protein